MNISPRRNFEGAKTDITVMSIKPITNTLNKDQKSGDATEVRASGELLIVRDQIPVIDTKTENNLVNSEGKRQLADGNIMKADISKERRELQKAIISEQRRELEQEER